MLEQTMFRGSDEKICWKRLSLLRVSQTSFSFFSKLIYLPGHILDKKRNKCNIQTKGQKIVSWHKNGDLLVVLQGKGCN